MLHQFFLDFIHLNLDIHILHQRGQVTVWWPDHRFVIFEEGDGLRCVNRFEVGIFYASVDDLINFFTSILSK